MMAFLSIDPGYTYFAVNMLNLVQALLDSVLRLLFDFTTRHGPEEDRRRAEVDYDKSAQLVDIVWRGAYTPACSHFPGRNYLLRHNRYLSPRFVLERDHVTLQGVSTDHAWFCVTGETEEEDVTRTTEQPFQFIAQYNFAKQLIIMPVASFHRLAAELGDPGDYSVVGVAMCGRSGSTLIAQMLHRLPDTMVYSEPWTITYVNEMKNLGLIKTQAELDAMVKSVMRLQCKPLNKRTIKRMVIKFPTMSVPLTPTIARVFPCMQHVFSVRHPKNMLESWDKFFQAGILSLFERFMRPNWWYDNLAFDYSDEKLWALRLEMKARETTLAEDNACIMAAPIDAYLRHKNLYKRCILYESMMADPEKELTALFLALDIPVDQVSLAMGALQRHSQNNLFVNASSKGRLDEAELARAEAVFRRVGLPFGVGATMEEYERHLKPKD